MVRIKLSTLSVIGADAVWWEYNYSSIRICLVTKLNNTNNCFSELYEKLTLSEFLSSENKNRTSPKHHS